MFTLLKWRPELELGVDMMDRHHRGMVGLCGAIWEKVGTRRGAAPASDLFFDLVKLTAMHFEAEEELMRRSDYPGRMDHQDRHHELSLLLKSWESRARHQNLPLNSSLLNHLTQWVENHILGSDKGFSRFLLGQPGGDPTDPTMEPSRLTDRVHPRGRAIFVQDPVDGRPVPAGESRLIGQSTVAFKTVSCHRFTQAQTARRHFNRTVARIKHL